MQFSNLKYGNQIRLFIYLFLFSEFHISHSVSIVLLLTVSLLLGILLCDVCVLSSYMVFGIYPCPCLFVVYFPVWSGILWCQFFFFFFQLIFFPFSFFLLFLISILILLLMFLFLLIDSFHEYISDLCFYEIVIPSPPFF